MSTPRPRSFYEIDKYVPLNIFSNVNDRYQLCHVHNDKDLNYAFIMKIESFEETTDEIILKNIELAVLTNINNINSNEHLEFCKEQTIELSSSETNNEHHNNFKLRNYLVKLKFNDLNNLNDTIMIDTITIGKDPDSVFHFDVKILAKCEITNDLIEGYDMTVGTQICLSSVGKK